MVELVVKVDIQVTPVLILVIVLFYLVVNTKIQILQVVVVEVVMVQQSEKLVV